jgi:hypothetical protein
MASGRNSQNETIAAIYAAQQAEKAAKEAANIAVEPASASPEPVPHAASGGPSPASVDAPSTPAGGPEPTREEAAPAPTERVPSPDRSAELEAELADLKSQLETAQAAGKKAETWEKLLQNDPVLYRMVDEHLRGQPTTAPKQTIEIPENFEELSQREQFALLVKAAGQSSAQAAIEALRPEIERVREEIRQNKEQERLSDEVAKAYPETITLAEKIEDGTATTEEKQVAAAWQHTIEKNPQLTPLQAYEIVLGRQTRALRAEVTATQKARARSASAIQKPGPGTEAQETFDPRKYRNSEEAIRAAAAFATRNRVFR